jgi:hypothetical protein
MPKWKGWPRAFGQLASVAWIVLDNMRLRARKPVAGLSGRIRVAVSPETAMRAGSTCWAHWSLHWLSGHRTVTGSVPAPRVRLRGSNPRDEDGRGDRFRGEKAHVWCGSVRVASTQPAL